MKAKFAVSKREKDPFDPFVFMVEIKSEATPMLYEQPTALDRMADEFVEKETGGEILEAGQWYESADGQRIYRSYVISTL